jgi:hypothetical protein
MWRLKIPNVGKTQHLLMVNEKNEEEKVQVVLANTKLNQKQVITEIIGIKIKIKNIYYE